MHPRPLHTLLRLPELPLVVLLQRLLNGADGVDETSVAHAAMRAAGVQIEALIEYVALFQRGDETVEARKDLLIEQREQLTARMEEMQQSLDWLNHKIERYEKGLMCKEQLLQRHQDGKENGHV